MQRLNLKECQRHFMCQSSFLSLQYAESINFSLPSFFSVMNQFWTFSVVHFVLNEEPVHLPFSIGNLTDLGVLDG